MDLRGLVDLVADDLESLELPAHVTRRHAEPRIVTPEQTPLLAVYPFTSDFEHLATEDDYTAAHELRVGWARDATAGAETGDGDDELAAAALAEVEVILQRLKTYAPGLPGAEGLYGTLSRCTFRLVGGLIWRAEASLRIDHLGY